MADVGPVLVHGYDPPAGGRWADNAIPGKLAAFDRGTGDEIWMSPCEVGYGRGFGAGFGRNEDVIVLGPGSTGHRIARMALGTGELLDVGEIDAFDEALVYPDLCVCLAPKRVWALESEDLVESWSHSRAGERYRSLCRAGDRIFLVYTHEKSRRQGVLSLNAKTGKGRRQLLAPTQPVIHQLASDDRGMAILASDLESALPPELLTEYLVKTADEDLGSAGRLALVAMDPESAEGDAPLWYESIESHSGPELPDESVTADSGKLYLVRGAHLEVRDMLTGRPLGDWTIPGLDERVGWQVCQGAGLLAEETRISVFELPA